MLGLARYTSSMTQALSHLREFLLPDESATLALGGQVAGRAQVPQVIFLRGDLGAGKTTFSRGFLRGRGHDGSVKSPTYTLVEPYDLGRQVWHLDLYRLGDESQWDELGVEEATPDLLLIEWPQRIPSLSERFDMHLTLDYEGAGRRVVARAGSMVGSQILELLRASFKPIT